HFVAGLGFGRSTARARQIMPDRFIEQRLIDRSGENRVGQVQSADFLVAEIDDVYARHGYCFDLRKMTYPPLGPGTAPLTRITLSSTSTWTISRFRTVTRSVPMRPPMRIP